MRVGVRKPDANRHRENIALRKMTLGPARLANARRHRAQTRVLLCPTMYGLKIMTPI